MDFVNRSTTMVLVVLLMLPVSSVFAAHSKASAHCRQAVGHSAEDLERLLKFCDATITTEISEFIIGALARETILTIKVDRRMADALVRDRLTAEAIVKAWMSAWKKLTGSKAVTVYVEWGDVQIAEGNTTIFSGDVVKIK